jgi:hypothetical protein
VKPRLATAAASVTPLASLTGCASTAGTSSAAATGTNRPAATATDSASVSDPDATDNEDVSVPEDTPSDEESTPEEAAPEKFGGSFTYEDGISVTISKPKPFTPSDTAAADEAPHYVQFTVTLVNGTAKRFDPALFNTTIQSANEEGDLVIDSAKGIGGGPNTKLLAGREAKFRIAYGVKDPKDLVLEVNPDFEHEAALFTS